MKLPERGVPARCGLRGTLPDKIKALKLAPDSSNHAKYETGWFIYTTA